MRANEYQMFARAVEEGVASGWRRAHKHVEQPPPEDIMAAIEGAVMAAVCEVFWFDGQEPQP